ncbi:hypothetical protein DMB44_09115 [Thermoplasma sp. Kam2015]|uniref:hypothetical protein n=1 Tax=Thermoplasma sp. Kam2015 TaxID=2094122 RepID=UPI000D8A3D3A|nr:hypothetical protein [Thermoplasma sp. Kam2015]PYB67458.1 hypothetical protein DMB44_09115 [Thermoplasma sp. Kam2015]
MQVKARRIATIILTIIVLFAGFFIYELESKPPVLSLRPVSESKLLTNYPTYGYTEIYTYYIPNNITRTFQSFVSNVTSVINVSYGSSNAEFIFYVSSIVESLEKTENPLGGFSGNEVVAEIGQNLSFPVTGFSFSIRNLIVKYNDITIINASSVQKYEYIPQWLNNTALMITDPPAYIPYNFTIGNFTAINMYYYINYSLEFIPIVEIGFIHIYLKPIHVSNSFLAPWGFKKPLGEA